MAVQHRRVQQQEDFLNREIAWDINSGVIACHGFLLSPLPRQTVRRQRERRSTGGHFKDLRTQLVTVDGQMQTADATP